MTFPFNVIARYTHGSGDSTDKDVVYIADRLPDKVTCKEFCSNKDENRNIITIKDGAVSEVYKGTVDEVNNALLDTYSLHPQEMPLLINRRLERDVYLKYIRSLRIILSHLSRSQYRPEIKSALRGGWKERLDILNNINFDTIDFDTLNKNMTGADIKKVIAFQIGQARGLFCGEELYTKAAIAEKMPSLKPYLYRQDPSTYVMPLNHEKFVYWEMLSHEIDWEEDGECQVTFKDRDENGDVLRVRTYNLIDEKLVAERNGYIFEQ
jgi:hypothetical protein